MTCVCTDHRQKRFTYSKKDTCATVYCRADNATEQGEKYILVRKMKALTEISFPYYPSAILKSNRGILLPNVLISVHPIGQHRISRH